MKLRLEKGNIKIRLTPLEVQRFYSEKFLDETIILSGPNQFNYSIGIEDNLEVCTVEFKQNSLIILIPEPQAERWINSNQVGIKETIVTESDDEIVLTLEEDLPRRKQKK